MSEVPTFSRADSSVLGRWWWTVDRWVLFAVLVIMAVGVILSMAASPSVANHLGLHSFFFVQRHVLMVPLALFIIVGVSLLDLKNLRRLALLAFFAGCFFMVLTLFWGAEIKGARRWVSFLSFSIQPSEFVKPALAVLTAWMFGLHRQQKDFPGHWVAAAFYLLTIMLLALQPDFGMIVIVSVFWFTQLFMTGLSLFWVFIGCGVGLFGSGIAYFTLPHVAKRIDRFLEPAGGDPYGDRYQINRSLEAFSNGGWIGQGPGEGTVKKYIPDVHADFIFAVAGEEFGLIFCWAVLGVFAFIILRSLMRIWQSNNFFTIIATTGLVTQFGLQTIVNISSSLRLMPTKGMTLPFISYGGSSMLASAMAIGMILALTRRQ